MKAKQITRQGYDLIHPQWIIDCVTKGDFIPLTKR